MGLPGLTASPREIAKEFLGPPSEIDSRWTGSADTVQLANCPAETSPGSAIRTWHPHDFVILHLEDDHATARLFRLALEKIAKQANYFHVTNGIEALDFLGKRGNYSDVPSPDLVILDLHVPKISGLGVLAEIRRRNLKVTAVLFSSSSDDRDRKTALQLGADAYLQKGGDFSAFVEAARSACALVPLMSAAT
jgi:CheY-like chemotaxis protein